MKQTQLGHFLAALAGGATSDSKHGSAFASPSPTLVTTNQAVNLTITNAQRIWLNRPVGELWFVRCWYVCYGRAYADGGGGGAGARGAAQRRARHRPTDQQQQQKIPQR